MKLSRRSPRAARIASMSRATDRESSRPYSPLRSGRCPTSPAAARPTASDIALPRIRAPSVSTPPAPYDSLISPSTFAEPYAGRHGASLRVNSGYPPPER